MTTQPMLSAAVPLRIVIAIVSVVSMSRLCRSQRFRDYVDYGAPVWECPDYYTIKQSANLEGYDAETAFCGVMLGCFIS